MSFVNGKTVETNNNEIAATGMNELIEAGAFYIAKPAVFFHGGVLNECLAAQARIAASASVH